MIDDNAWMEGRISVEAALQGGRRTVEAVYLRAGRWDRPLQQLRQRAEAAGIPVVRESEAFFAEHAAGQTHGGVLALVGPRRYESLETLGAEKERPFIVMLDGIEDPFNFGQAVRALYAAGTDGLVVRPRNWLTAVGTVTRAAAGATELLPTAVAETALVAARVLRERGLQIACTTRENARSLYDVDLTVGMFLLIGGEKRGITRSFLDETDLRLEIPYGRDYEASLGAAASTAVVAFETLRQRGTGLPDAAEQAL